MTERGRAPGCREVQQPAPVVADQPGAFAARHCQRKEAEERHLRQRPPIAVRHRRPVWRLVRRQLDAGLHEHESGLVALLFLKHRQTLGLGCLGGPEPLEIRELRKDENQDDDEQMDDDRQQHAFARGQCAWHPLDIRVSILEIEVHQ